MNVCVVGSSPLLLESDNGATIDSYDVVIRCNRYMINGYEKHVGTRTDYNVVNCHFIAKAKKNMNKKHFDKWGDEDSWGQEGVIVSKDEIIPEKFRNQKTINYMKQNRAFMRKHNLGQVNMAAGSCAILFAVEHLKAKTVSCYGFSRNYQGKCSHYYEKVSGKKTTHNHERELQLMIDLYGVKFYE